MKPPCSSRSKERNITFLTMAFCEVVSFVSFHQTKKFKKKIFFLSNEIHRTYPRGRTGLRYISLSLSLSLTHPLTSLTHTPTAFEPRRRASSRYRLHEFLEARTTLGLYFQYFTILLIFVSITSFVLSTVEPLHTIHKKDFQIVETLTALVFTAEYVARVYALPEMRRSPSGHDSERLHPSRIRWIFTDYYSLIDIVSFLPFYLDLLTPRDDIPVGVSLSLSPTHSLTHTSNTNTGDSVSSCTSYRAYASRGGSTPSRFQLLRSCIQEQGQAFPHNWFCGCNCLVTLLLLVLSHGAS